MRMKRFDISPTKLKVGIMTGGIREDKPQLELNMGDLIKGTNYQEIDGVFNGYRSLKGYEVYDGTALASSVAAPINPDGTYDDAAREVRRAAIEPVGDTDCTGPVLGVYNHVEDGVVYAVREKLDETQDLLYKTSVLSWVNIPTIETVTYTTGDLNGSGIEFKIGDTLTGSVSGESGIVSQINLSSGSWTLGTASGSIVFGSTTGAFNPTDVLSNTSGTTSTYEATQNTLGTGGSYKFIEGYFDLLEGLQRKPVVFFASCCYYPSYIKNDTIIPIIHYNLPDDPATNTFATSIVEFKNRLWLGYPDGRLFFSNVGDPHDFDSSTFSGVIYLEDEIVDLVVTTGDALVVFCKNSIQVVKALSSSDVTDQAVVDYLFSNATLNSNTGAVEGTGSIVLDDVLYIDNRGLTSIASTQNYGDFEIKSYSKGINNTLLNSYEKIVGASIVKEYNQYRLFFSDGRGIIFTFTVSSNKLGTSSSKTIKGITTFLYPTTITCCTEGYIGCGDGFVCKIESGTSFNGAVITTILETSYHHYNAPTTFKRFREVFFEGYFPFKLTFTTRAGFDYRNISYIKSTDLEDQEVTDGLGGVYGDGVYGELIYGSSENQTNVFYINSYGTTMNLNLYTTNKYVQPHTLSSMIVQYSINGRKM